MMGQNRIAGAALAAETRRRNGHKSFIRMDADPAVRFLLDQIHGSVAAMRAEVAAELGTDTIRTWRYRHDPRIGNLRRALQAIGYDLAVVSQKTGEVV